VAAYHPRILALGARSKPDRKFSGSRRSKWVRMRRTRSQEYCDAARSKMCLCEPYDIHADSRSLRSQLGYFCGDIVVQFQRSSTMSQNSSQQKLVSSHFVTPLFPLLAVELLALCVKCVSITDPSATTVAAAVAS
jgi:hypothetical protein